MKKILRKIRSFFLSEIIDNQKKIIEGNINIINIIESIKEQSGLIENLYKEQAKIIENIYSEFAELKLYLGLAGYAASSKSQQSEKVKELMAYHFITNTKLKYNFTKEAYNKAQSVFKLLKPMNIPGKEKVRLVPSFDGGYVTVEPDCKEKMNGIAYSFGISTYDPWSLEMTKRGYHIYQYDGTIKQGPYDHPMIHFYPYMISGSNNPGANEKNISQILDEHGHKEKNIILNMDIEGGEWDFFENITKEQILHFEQIIVEFHELILDDNINKKIEILKKINETHQCIHIHANNGGTPNLVSILMNFQQFPSLMEVTYIRKDPDIAFNECNEEFPSAIDTPNDPFYPDIYLGVF